MKTADDEAVIKMPTFRMKVPKTWKVLPGPLVFIFLCMVAGETET